jgi:hypothetical protein
MTDDENKQFLNAAIKSHCGAWWETYGRIWAKDRTKGLITPKRNYLQTKIQNTVDRMEDLGLPVRITGLKPRQRGSTTYFTAMGYTAMRRSSTSAVFIGGQGDQTVGLWQMMKTYKENDLFDWGNTGDVNQKGAIFSNGSRAKKETAKDVQAGIGDTYNLLHATEVARWAQYGVSNAAAVMGNILKAVPLLAGTSVFLESSAENAGGDFFDRFTTAVDSDLFLSGEKEVDFGSYVRVFAAWFQFDESALRLNEQQKDYVRRTLDADEEYTGEKELMELYGVRGDDGVLRLGETVIEYDVWEQLAWRRWAIREECDRDIAIFNRDYPHSWKEAFMKSGKMRFNSTGVAMLTKRKAPPAIHGILEAGKHGRPVWRNTPPEEAKFTIWEKPMAGRRYILPVDPMTGASQAAGLDPDKHSAPVLRAGYYDQTGKWVRPAMVGRVVPCRWEIDMLTDAIWALARYYGSRLGCMIAIEMNMDRGITELLKLRSANLYAREVFNRREVKMTSALGYKTDPKTREILITTLAAAVREWDTPGNGIDIWCPHAIEQFENFILKETGRSEAGQGYHDDDVLAIGLGMELIDHATLYVPERNIFGPPGEGSSNTPVTSQYS